MSIVLYLLFVQGCIAAFDTFHYQKWYYQRWESRLPTQARAARSELTNHVLRNYIHAILLCTLPWMAWQGSKCIALAVILVVELLLIQWKFLVAAVQHKQIPDAYPGERVIHAIMGIVYATAITRLLPTLIEWWKQPTGSPSVPPSLPTWQLYLLTLMGAGMIVSGLRDLYGFQLSGSPWSPPTLIEKVPVPAGNVAMHPTDTTQREPTR